MSTMRIQPLIPLPPTRSLGSSLSGSALPGQLRQALEGQTLKLTLDAQTGLPLLSTQEGQPLPIRPPSGHASLMPGDVVTVRVIATQPTLELAVVDRSPGRTPSGQPHFEWSPSTGQPDQAALLRLAWAAPDAPMVGASWRIMVLARLGAALPPQVEALLHTDRWHFATYAWCGLPVQLQLIPPEDSAARREARRRKALARVAGEPWGLCIDCMLPLLGRVEIRLQLSPQGAMVFVHVEDEHIARRLQEGKASQLIMQAVARAGLRLQGCRIETQAPLYGDAGPAARPDPLEARECARLLSQAPAMSLPAPLFQAGAEVLLALETLSPIGLAPHMDAAGPFSPGFR